MGQNFLWSTKVMMYNKKIKVCHMTSVHSSNDTRIFYKMCVSLAKDRYEVYLVAPGDSREEMGVNIVGVGSKPKSRLKRMIQISTRVYNEALKIDADIYHFHDPELLFYGLRLKRIGKKVIFDSHEDVPMQIEEKEYIPQYFRKIIAYSYQLFQDFVCKRLDAVVSVSPHTCDKLMKTNKNTWMITNYPILSSFFTIERTASEIICFAGGISKTWSHHRIIDILNDRGSTVYVLCGSTEPSYLKKLQNMPGWKYVDYKGIIPHENVSKIFETSNIGMAILEYRPNTAYTVGTMGNTKLFEYMMAGLPVICTDFLLWQEIIDKYKCGICVNPFDSCAINNAISYLVKHPQEAQRMGAYGRKAVEEEYNWLHEEKKLLMLYRLLLDSVDNRNMI